MADATSRRTALATAALVFALAAPLAYAAQRIFERSRGTLPDPLLVVSQRYTGYYWRVATATWWGILAAGGLFAWLAYTRAPRATGVARILGWAVLPVTLGLALLFWRLP